MQLTSNAEGSSDQPRAWVKPYYKSFNGLRAVAVLAVFIYHYALFISPLSFGSFTWAGVDLFFVLSGFLITGILYDSLNEKHFFRTFYIRRALRIFPVFYGFFLLLFLLTPLLHLRYNVRILGFFFYIGNLLVPFTDLQRHNPTIVSMLRNGNRFGVFNIGHLWSLCVEEQFYLVWPAILWLVRSRRALMGICAAGSVLALLIRIYLRHDANINLIQAFLIHWSTYTRFDTLLVGSWLSLWLRGALLSSARLKQIGLALFTLPVLILIVYYAFRLHGRSSAFTDPFLDTWGYTLIALAAAGLLLLSLDEASCLSRFLQWRPLAFLGTISYGFYFFHAFPEMLLQRSSETYLPGCRPVVPFVAFGLTVLVATLSFRFYEAPFLKLKSRFAPGHQSVPSGREEFHIAQ